MRAPTEQERMAAARTMHDIVAIYVPMLPLVVDVENAFVQPWVSGYYRSPFATYYKYVDIDLARKRESGAR